MEFTKMQGTGNDFIILNNMKLGLSYEKFSTIASQLCARRKSIGADGMIVVDEPKADGSFRMTFYNSDGSIGEMCGNGARCVARYAYTNNIAPKKMMFESDAGQIYAEVLSDRAVKVKLNNPRYVELNSDIDIDGRIYECSYIELGSPGVPHAVVSYPNLTTADRTWLEALGRKMRYCSLFSKGANVNFYELRGENQASVVTYERGVEGFTLACGTGSASVAAILMIKKYISRNKTRITVDGGDLFIDIDWIKDKITGLYLTGDTNIIAIGTVIDEDLYK